MANPLKNVCEKLTHIHMVCILGGVGTFAKEKMLELMWINSAKKRRRNKSLEVTGRWLRGHMRVRSVAAALALKLI